MMLLNGDALRIPLADESVSCVVTSPPYWSLRKYSGDQSRIWGGDAECEHEWEGPKGKQSRRKDEKELASNIKRAKERGYDVGAWGASLGAAEGFDRAAIPDSQYCLRCSAWYGSLGLEPTLDQFVSNMVAVFREVWRVLHPAGSCWINLGDSYNGSGGAGGDYNKGGLKEGQPRYPGRNASGLKPKDLCGIPWRVAFALQADGWWLRSDIIWAKNNPMPESVTDRPTKSHEYLFLLTKRKTYYYDADAIREKVGEPTRRATTFRNDRYIQNETFDKHDKFSGKIKAIDGKPSLAGRNRRTVWSISTQSFSGAHYATFPEKLVEPCIKAGSSEHGICPAPSCGSPWERTIDYQANYEKREPAHALNNCPTKVDSTGWKEPKREMVGWRPTCTHDLEPIPAIVADIFCGSGTTLLVARKLGRRAVGLDLSFDYLRDQAKTRLGLTALEEWETGKNGDGEIGDLPLFMSDGG